MGVAPMLLADADGFLKWPNVYDVVGLAGLAFAIWSIRLAKQDIKRQLDEAAERAAEAARGEVRRVAEGLLQTGVSYAIRLLELAREACHGKRWSRAADYCTFAREQLARVLGQPAADENTRAELQDVVQSLPVCVERLRAKQKDREGEVPDGVHKALDEALLVSHRAEGRMTGVRVGGDRG
jgi:hypothetical protein